MTFAFQHHHGAMLLKYSGISFISGAVNHGFFSGERSLWTAAAGVVLFVLGAAMEHRFNDDSHPQESSLTKTLILGAMLSVGLGFFTGGLQHFPDSPARSAWVVPLGFLISVPAMALQSPHEWRRGSTLYTVLLGVAVAFSSYATWKWLEQNPQYLGSHGHSHGETSEHGPSASGLVAQVVGRSIEMEMSDNMRFSPERIQVEAGETIRLMVSNSGQTEHELVIGTEEDIKAHAESMKKGSGHDHDHGHAGGAAITLGPGKKGELVVTFPQEGTLQMACLVPGHYEAGMRGVLQVTKPAKKNSASSAHDHSTHKH